MAGKQSWRQLVLYWKEQKHRKHTSHPSHVTNQLLSLTHSWRTRTRNSKLLCSAITLTLCCFKFSFDCSRADPVIDHCTDSLAIELFPNTAAIHNLKNKATAHFSEYVPVCRSSKQFCTFYHKTRPPNSLLTSKKYIPVNTPYLKQDTCCWRGSTSGSTRYV